MYIKKDTEEKETWAEFMKRAKRNGISPTLQEKIDREERGEDIQMFEDKIIQVCAECGRACCWYGEWMCADAQGAGTEKKTVSELRNADYGENERYWSDEIMTNIYGEPAPFGYKIKKEEPK